MKKPHKFYCIAFFALCSAVQVHAQAPAADRVEPALKQARLILAKGNVCEWYRNEDRIHWDFATQKTSDDWMAALTSISSEMKLDENGAARKLVDLCRQQLAKK